MWFKFGVAEGDGVGRGAKKSVRETFRCSIQMFQAFAHLPEVAPTALSTGYNYKILLLHRFDLQNKRGGSGHESSMMFVNSRTKEKILPDKIIVY